MGPFSLEGSAKRPPHFGRFHRSFSIRPMFGPSQPNRDPNAPSMCILDGEPSFKAFRLLSWHAGSGQPAPMARAIHLGGPTKQKKTGKKIEHEKKGFRPQRGSRAHFGPPQGQKTRNQHSSSTSQCMLTCTLQCLLLVGARNTTSTARSPPSGLASLAPPPPPPPHLPMFFLKSLPEDS